MNTVAKYEIASKKHGLLVVVLSEQAGKPGCYDVVLAGGGDVILNRFGLSLDEANACYGYVVETVVQLVQDGVL